jgi:hypothetical protein
MPTVKSALLTRWLVVAGLAVTLTTAGCSASPAQPSPSPTKTPLNFESRGLDCQESKGAQGSTVGVCTTITASGLGQEDFKVGDSKGPWYSLVFVCQTDGDPSSVSISGGPLLLTHFTNPEADFQWDPKAYPTLEISIDQEPRREIAYGVRNPYGKYQPDSISLLTSNPEIMQDLAGAKTLQVWARDADGVAHEFALDVEGNVEGVAKLAALGYSCKF